MGTVSGRSVELGCIDESRVGTVSEPFSVWYDRYLAELAKEGVPVPTEANHWATVYLSCNVAAWRDRDNKNGTKA